MNKTLLGLAGLVAAGAIAALIWGGSLQDGQGAPETSTPETSTPIVNTQMHGADAAAPARPADEIVVPELSAAASMGQIAFEESCASCHGRNAAGTDQGPPLIHKIYEPSHHADFAFQRAIRSGTPAHHWRFGDMSPVEGVTDKQIEWITRYVRELQRANGID